MLAANTAFNGFPVLGSILAQDRYLPRQLHTRGDRLAFSNGIILLAAVAVVFIAAFDADPNRLIQLYIVGVFVSFNMSQSGMIRHWTRLLRTETDPKERRRMQRSRLINGFGLVMTAAVLIVVLVTKIGHAWIAIATMVTLFVMMKAIRRHYDRVATELTPAEDDEQPVLPTGSMPSCWSPAAQAALRARLRRAGPAAHPGGGHRQRRPGGHRRAARPVG